jgi:hypothetical protein
MLANVFLPPEPMTIRDLNITESLIWWSLCSKIETSLLNKLCIKPKGYTEGEKRYSVFIGDKSPLAEYI